jgi:hypothetical protein
MSNYIQSKHEADFQFSYSDFTIEFFANAAITSNNSQVLFDVSDNSTLDFQSYLSGGNIYASCGTPSNTISSFIINGENISSNVMHFISFERYSNVFYLFSDGIMQGKSNVVVNLNNSSNHGYLTIGAQYNGSNAFIGEFGDFKITKEKAIHVSKFLDTTDISHEFPTPYKAQDIDIFGGDFYNRCNPEELVPGFITDSLQIKISQLEIGSDNTATPIIGYSLFKTTSELHDISNVKITTTSANDSYAVPWESSLKSAEASIIQNGNILSSSQWEGAYKKILLTSPINGNMYVIATGKTKYNVLGSNCVSTLTSPLYANSQSLILASTANFDIPNIPYERGYVFADGECISYLYNDISSGTLSGLTRGVYGTGTLNITNIGSQVINYSDSTDIANILAEDVGKSIWYSANSDTSLQNANTTISTLLIDKGSFIIS